MEFLDYTALQELIAIHLDKDIQLNYTTFPYAQARLQILKAFFATAGKGIKFIDHQHKLDCNNISVLKS